MSSGPLMRDLVCLVADSNIQQTMLGILARPRALGIHPISYDIRVHPEHDPGCFRRCDDFLRPFVQKARHALVIFDRHGCGQENARREKLEETVEERLTASGWQDKALAIAIDPELEAWIWSPSPHVDTALGWEGRSPDLRSWLREQSLLGPGTKSDQPKRAMEQALWLVRKPRSSAIYRQLAERVSVARCTDPAFSKLREVLRRWFPAA